MSNSIVINPAIITERQQLSSRQLTDLNTSINSTPNQEGNLDAAADTPAYILDLSDPAINHAANKLQATSAAELNQLQIDDVSHSPAYILDISNTSIRLAKEQQEDASKSTTAKIPETLISHIQG